MSRLLALVLSLLPFAASAGDTKDNWVEVRSANFLVDSNAGEKEARHVAKQFEEIRGVYREAFPKLRLDLGKPIIILAVKNENSMKALLPAYWEQKGHVHPAGLYLPGEEKHYVLLQTNAPGENPYHALYHEYTHALMHVNFPPLPLWLDEGFAEFYGNTLIGDKQFTIGKINISHLQLLQQSKLIPVEVLLQVDHRSPYYNEETRASIFYAESWALVHFLLTDPDTRKQQLLTQFLQAWSKSGNQVEAARQTFGDLKRFGQRIEAYARQQQFYMASQKSSIQADEKSYESRSLPLAESLARRGDFHLHMQRLVEARTLLDQATEEDANLALAHESLGTYYFRQHDLDNAAKELRRATELNSKSFLTYYYSAILNLQQARGMPEEWPRAEASLEKAIALNPSFAPAYANLATLYSLRLEKQDKALGAARRAVQLEPGTISYSLNLGYVLLNMGSNDEARALSSQILGAAKTPAEVTLAQAFQQNIEARAGMSVNLGASADQERANSDSPAPARTGSATETEETGGKFPRVEIASAVAPRAQTAAQKSAAPASADSAKPAAPGSVTDARAYEMTGKITVLDCSRAPEVSLTISISSIAMKLHAADLMKISVKDVRSTKPATAACPSWKGRSAKMTYHLTPGKEFDGELISVQFF